MRKHHNDKHHRKPTSIGGTGEARNISKIPKKKHASWHLLFSNMSAEDIAKEINEKYLDPDYVFLPIFIGNRDKDDVLKALRKAAKGLDYESQ